MFTGVVVSYMNFILFLLLLSGWFILQIDMNRYKRRKMDKERNTSKWLGWINLVLGTLGIVGNWFY